VRHDEYAQLTGREIVRLVASGETSAREVLQAHWDRIDQVNPALNAIIFENREDALAQATVADDRQAAGEPLGALHGLPMTNKDTASTAGMPATFGSPLLVNNISAEDDLLVSRLRAAGVVLTGKSNVPEFAAGAHTFNPVFGTSRNPYDLRMTPGGSSGGAAAAIAAGIQPMGDGSDMGGSIRIPAAFCNLVGLRPSRGRIPYISNNSWSWLGRGGPLARDAADLALLLSVTAGPDPRSPLSIDEPGEQFIGLSARPLAGLRVGWSPDFGLGVPVDPQIISVIEASLLQLQAAGATVERAVPDLSEADDVFREARAFDYELAFAPIVRANPDLVKPEVVENVAIGGRQTAADLRRLALGRTRLEGHMRDYFAGYDLLITPSTQSLPFPVEWRFPTEIDGVALPNYLDWMRSACLISAADVPAISIPAGFSSGGLPVGMQVVGPHGADSELLQFALAWEQLRGYPTTPRLPALVAESTRS
jgi:amidase